MSIPIVCFVGKSDSGKTTFLEKVIAELKGRGYRVGVVKHDTHASEPDRPGKDTWRLRQAGAARVLLSSARYLSLVEEVGEELALEEIVGRYLNDMEIVLTEGYKRSVYPKVEVCRTERSRELLCSPEELLAVVSDLRFDLPCPQFDLDDACGVADLLEERFLRRPGRTKEVSSQVALRVDGHPVPLKPFIQEMLAGAVRGLLGALKGGKGERIELDLWKG